MEKKGIILLTLAVLTTGNLFSQTLTDSLLTSFFNQTISDYFKQHHSSTKEFYLVMDSIPVDINISYQEFTLYPIRHSEAYPLIKKGKVTELFWARSKQISTDTIDVIIGSWSVSYERVFRIMKFDGKRQLITQNYNFGSGCGGTFGYMPDGRFIYDTKANIWSYRNQDSLINEALRKSEVRKQNGNIR